MSQEAPADVAEDVDVDEDLREILADVQAALEDLAGMDVDVDEPADLDRVRDLLPTEPHRAELIHAALPAALANAIEYVHPSDRQAGYWRRSRERRDHRVLSDAELVRRWEFSQAARELRGADGTTDTVDGRRIPRTAAKMREEMGGRDYDDVSESDAEEENGLAILARIRQWL